MTNILEATRNKKIYLVLSNQYAVQVTKKNLRAVLVAMNKNNEKIEADIENYDTLVIIKLK